MWRIAMTELYRFLRHAFAPLVAYAVAQGWLPESAQGDVLEMLVIALGVGIPYAISWWRDQS